MDELLNKVIKASQLEEWEAFDKAAKIYNEVLEDPSCPPTLKTTVSKRLAHLQRYNTKSEEGTKTSDTPEVSPQPETQPISVTGYSERDYVYQIDPFALVPIESVMDAMPIQESEYQDLKEDIKTRGIQTPLIALPDYRLLCGYNRLRIAKEIGLKTVPVIFRDVQPKNILIYALLDNIKRRHLTREQIAKYIGELPMLQVPGRPPKGTRRKSNKELAKALGVSTRTITRARSYARKIRENPSLAGLGISEVLEGTKAHRVIKTYTYTIGVNDMKMVDDFVDIAENLFGFSVNPGDTIKMVVQAYHTRRG